MSLPTIGGQVTRMEVYIKILHHIDEIRDLTATMAHLHNTEGNDMDSLLAKGWLGMHELFASIRQRITALAANKLN